MKTGYDLLNDPFLNKGTAFTIEERIENGLVGLLPPHVQTLEEQARQAYEHICRKDAGIFSCSCLIRIAPCSIRCSANT